MKSIMSLMNRFNQNILYSRPDDIGSCGDCSLNSSAIQCLSKHHNHDDFKHIPNLHTLMNYLVVVLTNLKERIEN